jgi:hypothetical protein
MLITIFEEESENNWLEDYVKFGYANFISFIYFIFFFYSYVHTMFGSFYLQVAMPFWNWILDPKSKLLGFHTSGLVTCSYMLKEETVMVSGRESPIYYTAWDMLWEETWCQAFLLFLVNLRAQVRSQCFLAKAV